MDLWKDFEDEMLNVGVESQFKSGIKQTWDDKVHNGGRAVVMLLTHTYFYFLRKQT